MSVVPLGGTTRQRDWWRGREKGEPTEGARKKREIWKEEKERHSARLELLYFPFFLHLEQRMGRSWSLALDWEQLVSQVMEVSRKKLGKRSPPPSFVSPQCLTFTLVPSKASACMHWYMSQWRAERVHPITDLKDSFSFVLFLSFFSRSEVAELSHTIVWDVCVGEILEGEILRECSIVWSILCPYTLWRYSFSWQT